jgi:hypothetical protein
VPNSKPPEHLLSTEEASEVLITTNQLLEQHNRLLLEAVEFLRKIAINTS